MDHARLDSVLNLAEAKENTAARGYADARGVWEFNQSKLEELRQFRDEYREPTEGRGQPADQFRSARHFLGQLSAAIEQQEVQVEQLLSNMNQEEEQWSEFRTRRKSIEKLIDRRTSQAVLAQARSEQKASDELSLRQTLERRGKRGQ